VREFKPQELANTAWAFATVNRTKEKQFVAFVEQNSGRGAEGERVQAIVCQHGMGVSNGEAVKREAVCGWGREVRSGGRATSSGRASPTLAWAFAVAVCSLGERGGAACEQTQVAGVCQHGMGVLQG